MQAEIEYYAVNLKSTLTRNKQLFANLVQQASDRDITCLEIETLQTVIEYKWINYTKGFFIWRFCFHLFFIFWLLLDLVFCSYTSPDKGAQERTRIISKFMCSITILYFAQYELKQFYQQGWKEYTSSFWNLFDNLLIYSYLLYVPLSFIMGNSWEIKSIQCILVLLAFIKVTFFLRIFDGFSFLV